MVGAILSVTVLSILTGTAYMPSPAKVAAQSMAGAFIACGIEQDDVKNIPKLWKPLLVLLTSLLIANLTVGFVTWKFTPLTFLTAMLGALPGGMSDSPIIAADMGADAGKVAILQFIRMSTGIGVFPSLILLMTKNQPADVLQYTQNQRPLHSRPKGARAIILTLIVAFSCGAIGKLSGIPAGTLIFSMFGIITLKFLSFSVYLPMWIKRLAQVLAGAYIGCGTTKTDLLELPYLILPVCLILIGYFLNSLLTGRLLRKLFGFPLRSAMLIATPAGASDMALISSDLGVEDKTVIELQIIRMVVVISVFPQIISVISALL